MVRKCYPDSFLFYCRYICLCKNETEEKCQQFKSLIKLKLNKEMDAS